MEDWIKMSACKTIIANDFILRNFMYMLAQLYFSIYILRNIIKHILVSFY